NSGLPNNHIASIAIDGYGNKWIGTYGGGLAKFDNTNWTIFNSSNSDLISDKILCLAIDRKGNKWIGTTLCKSVYREGGVILSAEEKLGSEIPKEYSLLQNYPNPFNPTTTINFSIVKSGKVSLKVYDMLGREIKILINEEKAPGKYNVTFNGAGLASGIYFYRLQTDNFVETKKLVLMK
ncbi:MAG: T9SS type A sorting domain-containing protein, partial [Bacteroidota bacterium]|nr:T9SS type A sorting domain-containing protein [Bacteroidota bacterium]